VAGNERLAWLFELFDKMSGPADKISASLAGMNVQVNITQNNINKMGRSADGASKGFLNMGAGLGGWFSIAKGIAGTAISIGETLGGWAMAGASWVLDTLSFKESMMASFRILEGSEVAAKKLFDRAIDFAAVTPFSTREVIDAFKALRGAGIQTNELENVFAGLADVGALSGNPGAMKSIIYQLAQAKGKGKLQMVDWRVMAEHLGPAGLGQEVVFANIAKNMKIAPTAVAAAMEAGQITWRQGLFAILEAAQTKFGKLGQVAIAQGSTISGMLETLKSRPDEWLFKDDAVLNAAEGIGIFKGALANLNEVLRVGSKSGERIQTVLFGIINRVSKGLFGDLASETTGLQAMEDLVIGVAGWAEKIFNLFAGIASFIKGFAVGLSPALGGIFSQMSMSEMLDPKNAALFATQMEKIGKEAGRFAGEVMKVSSSLTVIAGQLTTGPLARLFGLTPEPTGESPMDKVLAATGFWDSTPKVSANIRERGAERSWWDDIPGARADKGAKLAPSPYDKTVAWARGQFGGGASGGAPASAPTVSIPIHIDNRGNQGDADAISRKLESTIPAALGTYFQTLATEGGS